MTPPAAALVDRFRTDLDPLLGDATGPKERLGLAVSGGPDSLAMLLLAAAGYPGRVEAATVDHGIRPANAEEAAAVAGLCAALAVPHATLRAAEPPPSGANQGWARTLRYRLLARWVAERSLGALLTAHHADDQAETLLMRLNRGSGLGGLAGIRGRETIAGVAVLRPLLGWRREELRVVVAGAGLAAADDPSNRDPRHDRTHARALLAADSWLDPCRLANSASHLAKAEAALAWLAEREFANCSRAEEGTLLLDAVGLPAELQRRLLMLALERFGVTNPDGPTLARLHARLCEGGTGTIGGVRACGGPVWRLAPAPPRRSTGSAGTRVGGNCL